MEITWHWHNKGKRGSLLMKSFDAVRRSVVTVTTGWQSISESTGGPSDVVYLKICLTNKFF